MTLIDLMRKFPGDDAAEAWYIEGCWPKGIRCVHCDSDKVSRNGNHPCLPLHCKGFRKFFSTKTSTATESSKVGYHSWAMAIYILSNSIKGMSSMKLHPDLGVTQKTAWHLAHRIQETWNCGLEQFAGPVEADETYIDGR